MGAEINLLYPKAILHKKGKKEWIERFYYDDSRVCEYCGITEKEYRELRTTGDGPLTLTKDHTIPKAKGGGGSRKAWACIKCNLIKNHTFTYEEMLVIGKTIVGPLWKSIANKKRGD